MSSLDNVGGDGEPSENDNVAPDVENVVGGRGPDTILGSDSPNGLTGGAGEDFLDGLGGRDDIRAGDAVDLVRTRDGAGDGVSNCGSGKDFVIADPGERSFPGCETVDNRLLDRPVGGRTIALAPRGTFALRLPDAQRFFDLGDHVNFPVRSIVDSKRGTVRLTASRKQARKTKRKRRGSRRRTVRPSGDFSGGIFRVSQRSARSPLALALEGNELAGCAQLAGQGLRRGKRRRWINAITIRTGYSIRGRWSSGTTYGTKWTVEDYCEGTRTVVDRGAVKVRDRGRRRTVIVRPASYKPPRRRGKARKLCKGNRRCPSGTFPAPGDGTPSKSGSYFATGR